MSNVTHAQQLFDKMDFKKLKPLNSSLEDISKDLREQLKDEFDLENLSYEDREDLHRGVEEIIKKSKKTSEGKKISELDKKRYLVLRRELAFRYPPKIKLTDDIAEKLISRDQLASDIRKNREANFGNGRPKGNIKINAKGLEINLDEEIYKKKIDEFKKYLSETEGQENEEKQNYLAQLDTQLAELVILSHEQYIQLNNETLLSSDSNFKEGDEVFKKEALRAIRGIRKGGLLPEGKTLEYVVIESSDVEENREESEELKIYLSRLQKELDAVQFELDKNDLQGRDKMKRKSKLEEKEKIEKLIEKGKNDLEELLRKIEETKRCHVVRMVDEKKESKETLDPDLLLELKGDSPMEVENGSDYRESGCIATWRPEGKEKGSEDVSDEIVVKIKNIETKEVISRGLKVSEIEENMTTIQGGSYEIIYTITKDYTDEKGEKRKKKRSKTRKVVIKEKEEPIDPVNFEDDLNIAGVLSDESTSFDEKLSRLVETDLQKEWADAAKLNFFKRGYLFLSRGRKRRKLLKEKLRSEKNKIFDTEAVAQADRHDIERTLYDNSGIETKISLDNPAKLNEIARKYLENSDETAAAVEFEKDFLDFVEHEPHIKKNKKDLNIKFMGTNMLEQLKAKKAERTLRKEISDLFSQYISDKNKVHLDEANQKIAKYVEDFKRDPVFRKMLLNADGTIDSMDEAKMNKFIQHQTAVEQAGLKNLSIKLDLLTKGKGAYEIDNKDREVGKSAWLFKFGRWLDKKPRYAQVGAIAGLGIATSLTAGALGGAFAAGLATTITMSGAVGFKNFVKKWTHHTKEQNTHEKNLVRDYDRVTKKMELWRQDMGDSWLGKWIPGKRYRGKRQRELYDQTTQHNFADTKETTDFIMAGLTKLKPTSSAYDKNQYNFAVMEAKARLDMYKQSGHNFLKSNEASKVEQDMRELERALLLVAQREGSDVKSGLSSIEARTATNYDGNSTSYEDIKQALTEDYDKATKKFRKERSLLARKRGIATAAITAGTSVGSQYLLKTGMWAPESNPVTTVIDPGRQEMNVDISGQQFALSKAELIDGNLVHTQSQNLFSNLGKGDIVELHFSAGTDGTAVRGAEGLANLTNLYTTKLDVVRGLAESSQLANKGDIVTLIDQLKAGSNSTLWTADWVGKGFLSDQLQGARCLELLEETLRGVGNSEATLNLFYDSANSIAGTSRNTASERVGNAFFKVLGKAAESTTTGGTTPRWRKALFFPIPRFSNTFQRQRKETDEELKDIVYRGDVPENGRDNPPEDSDNGGDNPPGGQDNGRNDPPENPEDENKRKEIKKFWKDFDRKVRYVPYKPVDPEKEPEKFYKDDFSDRKLDKREVGTKQTVSTRGQKIEGYDSHDYGTDYPGDGKELPANQLAGKIFMNNSLFPEDQQVIQALRKRGATIDEIGKYLEDKITQERKHTEIKKEKREFDKLLDQCYDSIPKYLTQLLGADLTKKFNIPLNKNRVHLVGDAEYRAVAGSTSSGVFRSIHGDVYISLKAIEQYENKPPIGTIVRSTNGGVQNIETVEFPRIFREIKHILIHEMLHSMSVLNYANINEEIYPRRLGLLSWNTFNNVERGRYFNESATENLTQTILEMLYHEEGLVNYKAPWIAYPQYLTTVQKLIETDDDIEWSDFYTAMLLRRYQDGENIEKNTPLFKLVAKVNGGENPATAKRPYYYQIIMNLLDNGFTKEALDFIRTKDMNVFLEKVKKNKVFRSILLNKDETDYKEEIFNAYRGIRDDDEDDSETDEEQAKEARKQEIKKLIKSKVLQRALENTTEKTDTLTITDPGKESKLPNEFLNDNRNWENLHKLLPNLKKLKLEGKNNILLSTMRETTFELNNQIFTDFKTQLEELIISNNYVNNLNWLRKTSDDENITLRKIDLTGNQIKILNYDDFKDLPEGTEIIIKDNPINTDTDVLQKFKDGLASSEVKVKFIWE